MAVMPLLFMACQKPTGNVKFSFSFYVDNELLQQDTCKYVNAAGNCYEVTEAQYFISDVVFTRNDGTTFKITTDSSAHYVDADIVGTLSWLPTDELPAGVYKSVSFVFGLSPELNHSYFYPNAPENNMSWPAYLGGGYHYMKINGKWRLGDGALSPFNLHTGIGQQRDANGNIIGFIDNSFTVTLPLSNFEVSKNNTTTLHLRMNINNWFTNPNTFDFNVYGGSIMQNQAAQEVLKENGHNVFSVE